MATEPSRNPSTLSEADARFRYVLADPAARGRFREGMGIAESIYRPLVAKLQQPAGLTEAEIVAVMGALIGAGRSTYEAKAVADLLPREATGALGLPFGEVGEAMQSLLSVIADREEHTVEEIVAAVRGRSFDEGAWWEGRFGPLVDDLTKELFPEDDESERFGIDDETTAIPF